jgi:hypothetical protein
MADDNKLVAYDGEDLSDAIGLKPKQRLCIEIMARGFFEDSDERVNITNVCKRVGITRQTYYRWMTDPKFASYYASQVRYMAKSALKPIIDSVVGQAAKGNIQAAKLFLQYVNELDNNVNLTVKPGQPFGGVNTLKQLKEQIKREEEEE